MRVSGDSGGVVWPEDKGGTQYKDLELNIIVLELAFLLKGLQEKGSKISADDVTKIDNLLVQLRKRKMDLDPNLTENEKKKLDEGMKLLEEIDDIYAAHKGGFSEVIISKLQQAMDIILR